MPVTTADCKKAIIEWANNFPFLHHLEEKDLKRTRKYKSASGDWVREFSFEEDRDDIIYVKETGSGLEVSFCKPDTVWAFHFTDDCVMKANDVCLYIVDKAFYDKEGYVDDLHISHKVGHLLPDYLDEEAEALFRTTKATQEEVRQYLLNKGFVELNVTQDEEMGQNNSQNSDAYEEPDYSNATWVFEIFNDDVEPGQVAFMVADKDFFDAEGCFDSVHLYDHIKHLLPPDSDEVMEASFIVDNMTEDQVRAHLLSKGFVEVHMQNQGQAFEHLSDLGIEISGSGGMVLEGGAVQEFLQKLTGATNKPVIENNAENQAKFLVDAQNRHFNLVDAYLEQGFDPNLSDPENGNTPLIYASIATHLACMKSLVEHGADVNATNNEGSSPLLEIAKKGRKECLAYLMENKADINHMDVKQMTALHYATQHDQIDTIQTLLCAGASVKQKNSDGLTARELAEKLKKQNIVKIFEYYKEMEFLNSLINSDNGQGSSLS